MTTILALLDGSPVAERSLLYAERLARAAGFRVVLTQFVPVDLGPGHR